MKKILCITPVKHLEGVFDLFGLYGEVVYEPNISKTELKEIKKDKSIEYIFLLTQINKGLY